MPYKITFLFISLSFFIACSNNAGKDRETVRSNPTNLKQHLQDVNKIVVHNVSEKINEYTKIRQWNMQSSGTGLRYMIYENGNGNKAIAGNLIKLKYSVELLDSSVCYSNNDNEPMEFSINQSDQIRGLHELALFLKKGDKAKAILPPHLAYGLTGDGKKIPKNAVLVYDIEVLNIK